MRTVPSVRMLKLGCALAIGLAALTACESDSPVASGDSQAVPHHLRKVGDIWSFNDPCIDFDEGPIDTTIALSISRDISFTPDSGRHEIEIVQYTDRWYPHLQYVIVNEVTTAPGVIHIEYTGLASPLCGPVQWAFGPADRTDHFVVSGGTYRLKFTNGNVTDKYNLEITDSTLSVTPIRQKFTRLIGTARHVS